MVRAPLCNVPEQIFVDDRPLLAAAGKDELATGRFFLDTSKERVYLADDPTHHAVEVTAATFAFEATAPGILISNVIIEKYAGVAQTGAIQVQTPLGDNWTIEHCELRLNSAGGIAVGNGTQVHDCDIHHNGQIGITGVGDGVDIAENEVWANNTRGFQFRWEAGGIKLAESKGVVFRANKVHDNDGPGLWCDINCERAVYEGNVVERNEGPGIFYEISSQAVIRNNYLRHNGIDGKAWFWGVNILVAESQQVAIIDNVVTVVANGCGIVLKHQSRSLSGTRGAVGLYETRNNLVQDNLTTFEGSGCAGAASDVAPGDENYALIETGSNVFNRNSYRIPYDSGRLRFEWGHAVLDWSELASRGVERDGRLIRY
jgi:parallel beta-helix repeat protein